MKKKVEALIARYHAARALRVELEAGVEGTMFNPSDSDQTPGRIGFCDIHHAKGISVALAWDATREEALKVWSAYHRMRSAEARAAFRAGIAGKPEPVVGGSPREAVSAALAQLGKADA